MRIIIYLFLAFQCFFVWAPVWAQNQINELKIAGKNKIEKRLLCEDEMSKDYVFIRFYDETFCFSHGRKKSMCIWIKNDTLLFRQESNALFDGTKIYMLHDKELIDNFSKTADSMSREKSTYLYDSIRYGRECSFDSIEIEANGFRSEVIVFGGIDAADSYLLRKFWLLCMTLEAYIE